MSWEDWDEQINKLDTRKTKKTKGTGLKKQFGSFFVIDFEQQRNTSDSGYMSGYCQYKRDRPTVYVLWAPQC